MRRRKMIRIAISILSRTDLTPADKIVYGAITSSKQKLTHQEIADWLCLSEKQVGMSEKRLRELNLL